MYGIPDIPRYPPRSIDQYKVPRGPGWTYLPDESRKVQQHLAKPQDWFTVDLDWLKNHGYAWADYRNLGLTDGKIDHPHSGGEPFNIVSFINNDGIKMTIGENIGANVLDFSVNGLSIIESDILVNTFRGKHSASGYGGMPFISPPNRIRNNEIRDEDDRVMTLSGQNLQFRLDTEGNIIHGKLFKLPWERDSIEFNPETGGIRVTYVNDTREDKALRDNFGYGLYELTHTMEKNRETGNPELTTDIAFTNYGDDDYPLIGYGLHPYLKVDRDFSEFRVPADTVYEAEKGLPTGELISVSDKSDYDFRDWTSVEHQIDGERIDHVYTDLKADNGVIRSEITRKGDKLVYIEQSPDMNHITVCNNSIDKNACINIEPQTCSTDASNLARSDTPAAPKATPKFVKPGETVRSRVVIGLQQAA